MTNSSSAAYQDIRVIGVYNPPGTNDPEVVTVESGKVFVARTPEQFSYDDDGNLTSDGRFNYSWDAENRLIGAETLTNLTASVPRVKLEFTYDYMSRRTSKTVFNWVSNDWSEVESRNFVYDSWNLIHEIAATSTPPYSVTNSYVWGLDLSGTLQGAGGIGGLLAAKLGTNSVVYSYDGNGNVSELIHGDSGAINAHYEYSPFGQEIVSIGSLAKENTIRFSSKYWDDEISLGYWGYRYYHPEEGRWLSRDPLGEKGGLNFCQFNRNNPICRVDSWGLYTLLFPPWWSGQEINQVEQAFFSQYSILDHAAALIKEKLKLLAAQPNTCPYKMPLIQQYIAALARIQSIRAGLDDASQHIYIVNVVSASDEAWTTETGYGSWVIGLSNPGSVAQVLHELSHHYGTEDTDNVDLGNAHQFDNLALGGTGNLNLVESAAKEKYGTKDCCPMSSVKP